MIKRKTKVIDGFSMSSMTDIIFLLLIFFMLTSSIVVPNVFEVNLPEGSTQTNAKPMARVAIKEAKNADGEGYFAYFVQWKSEEPKEIVLEELTGFLLECKEKDSGMFVALYADASSPYGEVVKIMNIANENGFKLVLATQKPNEQ
jgi:biopolymer transport protein ExbD